jgi:hypothetical protein
MANLFTRSLGNGGLTSLQTLLGMPDPMLNFKWICNSLPFGHPINYVEGIDLPFLNIDIGDKVHSASGYTSYPGTHNISSFSITFYEDSFATTSKFIWAWKNKIKDFKTGLYNLPIDYKQEIEVVMLDQGNNPVMSALLIGVWPSDTGNFSLNYTDAGRVTITQTFSIDDQSIEFFF